MEEVPLKAVLEWLGEPIWEEREDSWKMFEKGLKRRGMKRVGMVISDAHRGIQATHHFHQCAGGANLETRRLRQLVGFPFARLISWARGFVRYGVYNRLG